MTTKNIHNGIGVIVNFSTLNVTDFFLYEEKLCVKTGNNADNVNVIILNHDAPSNLLHLEGTESVQKVTQVDITYK